MFGAVLALVFTATMSAGSAFAQSEPPEQGDPPAQLEDLSGAEALVAGEESFPTVVGADAWEPFQLRDGERVEKFLSRTEMLIEQPDGTITIAKSSFPLRTEDRSGSEALVDLQLQSSADGWVPRNPIFPLRIGRSLEDGVSFADQPVLIKHAGGAQHAALVNEVGAFYPNVLADTDYLVAPRPAGAELMWQLRSGESPEEVGLEFEVPADATVTEVAGVEGALQFIRDGKLLGYLSGPRAFDAELRSVPVSTTLSERGVSYRVEHRGKDYAYPILLDPAVEHPGGRLSTSEDKSAFGTNYDPWAPLYSTFAGHFTVIAGNGWGGNGLHVETKDSPSQPYLANQYAQFQYPADRESNIYRAEFKNFSHEPWFTHATLGLYNLRGGNWESQKWWGFADTSTTSPGNNGARNVPGAASSWYTDVCAMSTAVQACDPDNGAVGNKAQVTLHIDAAPNRPPTARLFLGGSVVYLYDKNSPALVGTVSHTPARPSAPNWFDAHAASMTAQFRDEGLGMKYMDLVLPGSPAVSKARSKYANTCNGPRECPTQDTGTVAYNTADLPSGKNLTIALKGEDLVRHRTLLPWLVNVDHVVPTGSLSGTLLPGGSNEVEKGGSYTLKVDADDAHSGAKSIKVEILSAAGTVERAYPVRSRANCGVSTVGCADDTKRPYSESFSVATAGTDLPYGQHQLRVTVTDFVNRTVTLPPKGFSLTDRTDPRIELTGGLRKPLGGGRDLDFRGLDDGSGMKSLALWLDPTVPTNPPLAEAKVQQTNACSAPCPNVIPATGYKHYDLPADTPEGKHRILVRAVDALGRASEEAWDVFVVNVPTDNRSRLGLESWFTYDETAAGGESSVFVNGETGNAIWHSVPISNLGQGLSTVVNLTYNSHDTGGIFGTSLGRSPIVNVGGASLGDGALAGLSYAEAGVGFSIGISGPTRVNEPLHGVLQAATAEETAPATADGLTITMNDADGTEHRFTRTAGRWVAPPGLNMYLRRYQDGGSAAQPLGEKWAMTRPDGVTHFFDSLGYLTKTQDRNSNALIYTYERVDAFSGTACQAADVIGQIVAASPARLCTKRLVKVTDAGGQDLTVSYKSGPSADAPLPGLAPTLPTNYPALVGGRAGRIDTITDHGGRTYKLDYTEGYLTRFSEAANKSEKRVTKLDYETVPPVLAGVGHDRQLRRVVELRDLNADGTIADSEEFAATALDYPPRDGAIPPPGLVRTARRATKVIKRNGAEKRHVYRAPVGATPAAFDTIEQLHRAVGATPEKTATRTAEIDARGRTTKTTDPLGTVTALGWDDVENKVTRTTSALGTADETPVDYTYDSANRTGTLESTTTYPSWPATADKRVTDLVWSFGAGRHQSLAPAVAGQDAAGSFVADLDRLENPKPGTGRDFSFDIAGNVTHSADAKGDDAETVFDTAGRVTREYDELRNFTDYADFHPTGLPKTVIDPRSKMWTYGYDALGNVSSIVDPRATNRSGAEGNPYTTTRGYDAFDRVITDKAPKLSSTGSFITRSWSHDRNGNQLAATDGEGKATRSTYTKDDLPERVTAPRGAEGETTAYAYDDADRMIAQLAPKGADGADLDALRDAQQSTCTGASQPTPAAYLTRYCLDDAGRMRAQVRTSTRTGDPASLVTAYAYDRRDNQVAMIDPKRNVGRTPAQAIAALTTAGNLRRSFTFNKADEPTSETDLPTETGTGPGGSPRGPIRWDYGYDANGNRTTSRDPRGAAAETVLSYDHRDALIGERDPLGRLTCTERRADGRVIGVTTPRGTASNPTACTDGDPNTTYASFSSRLSYDDAGDLLSRSVPVAAGQYGMSAAELANWKTTYIRNSVGNPTTITDARGKAYDNEFYDSGELRSTQRPSAWTLDEQTGDLSERSAADPPGTGAGDAEVDQNAKGDFGAAAPEPLPSALPKAGTTTFGYDNEMRLTTVTDVANKVHSFGRDDQGRLTSHTVPYGPTAFAAPDDPPRAPIVTHQTYDRNGNLSSTSDGGDHTTTFEQDQYDRLVTQTAPGSATATETTALTYDANDNLTRRTTAGGPLWQYGFDSVDRQTSMTDPRGKLTTSDYDIAGNRTYELSPRGQSAGNADRYADFWTYNNANERVKYEAGRGHADGVARETTSTFDADGNETRHEEPGSRDAPGASLDARVTRNTYDGRGLLWAQTTGTGNTERTRVTEFDANGNLRRQVNPAGVARDTELPRSNDPGTAPAATSTWTEHATVFSSDADNLLTATYLPWGSKDSRDEQRWAMVVDRDDRGRISFIKAPHLIGASPQKQTTYAHYDNGWIRSSKDSGADPHKLIYDYDQRGNQTLWSSEGKSRQVERTFFPNGLLKQRTGVRQGDPDRKYTYTYTPNRSLASMTDVRANDADRVTLNEYDSLERQTRVNQTWQGSRDTKIDYDDSGNVSSRRTDGAFDGTNYNGGKTTTFTYDERDREISMLVKHTAHAGTRTTETSYFPSGEIAARERTRTSSSARIRDARYLLGDGRLTSRVRDKLVSGQPTQNLKTQNYAHDDQANADADPAKWGNGNRSADERGTHQFNARGQLRKWTRLSGTSNVLYETNGAGAITKKTDGTLETTYNYDPSGDRVDSAEIRDTLTGQTAQTAFSYNLFGDLTQIAPPTASAVEQYEYDGFERQTKWSKPNAPATPAISYSYDGLDRRDTRSENGTTFDYAYVGSSEKLSREETAGGKTQFFDYDSGLDRIGRAEQPAGGTPNYEAYTTDANGSVETLENADGTAAESYAYDPYGTLTADPGGSTNPFLFQGHHLDRGDQTYDMQARQYRPDLSRFLTTDRFEDASDDLGLQLDPMTNSRYAFAGGNPVGNVEFDGHCARSGNEPCAPMGSKRSPQQKNKARKITNDNQKAEAPGWKDHYTATGYRHKAGYFVTPTQASAASPDWSSRFKKALGNTPPGRTLSLGKWANHQSGIDATLDGGCLRQGPNSGCQIGSIFGNDPKRAGLFAATSLAGGAAGRGVAALAPGVASGASQLLRSTSLRRTGTAAQGVPKVVFSRSRAPGIGRNFDDAVANGAPTRLTRVNAATRDANRRAALRGQRPAPAGQSLDEYPFACSAQGGCGSFVRPVAVGEQHYQGGVLSGFFQQHGVRPGDPFDVTFGP